VSWIFHFYSFRSKRLFNQALTLSLMLILAPIISADAQHGRSALPSALILSITSRHDTHVQVTRPRRLIHATLSSLYLLFHKHPCISPLDPISLLHRNTIRTGPFIMDCLFYWVPLSLSFLSPFKFTALYLVPLLVTFLFFRPYLATQLPYRLRHHMLTLSSFYLSTFRLIPIGSTVLYLSWLLLIYRLIGLITLPP
jgi:hypothetical protein